MAVVHRAGRAWRRAAAGSEAWKERPTSWTTGEGTKDRPTVVEMNKFRSHNYSRTQFTSDKPVRPDTWLSDGSAVAALVYGRSPMQAPSTLAREVIANVRVSNAVGCRLETAEMNERQRSAPAMARPTPSRPRLLSELVQGFPRQEYLFSNAFGSLGCM